MRAAPRRALLLGTGSKTGQGPAAGMGFGGGGGLEAVGPRCCRARRAGRGRQLWGKRGLGSPCLSCRTTALCGLPRFPAALGEELGHRSPALP